MEWIKAWKIVDFAVLFSFWKHPRNPKRIDKYTQWCLGWQFFFFGALGGDFFLSVLGGDFFFGALDDDFFFGALGGDFFFSALGGDFFFGVLGDNFFFIALVGGFFLSALGGDFFFGALGGDFFLSALGGDFLKHPSILRFRNNCGTQEFDKLLWQIFIKFVYISPLTVFCYVCYIEIYD